MNTWIFVFYGIILYLLLGYLLTDTYVNNFIKKYDEGDDLMTWIIEGNPGYTDEVYWISYIVICCLTGIPTAAVVTYFKIRYGL